MLYIFPWKSATINDLRSYTGGSGTGAGAGTGNAGPGGVSASGVRKFTIIFL